MKLVSRKPVKTKEMQWNKVGNLYLLMDKDKDKTYSLDPIAFLVWVQCDGKTDLEQIVDVFSVDGNRDIIKSAISGILEKLKSSGLIKWI